MNLVFVLPVGPQGRGNDGEMAAILAAVLRNGAPVIPTPQGWGASWGKDPSLDPKGPVAKRGRRPSFWGPRDQRERK
jgi:hypothetical protein